jgi:hypothetical protein
MFTLQNEIAGFVVVDDAVRSATIVGITSDNKLVAIVDDTVSIEVRNVEEAFLDAGIAQEALQFILTDRRVSKQLLALAARDFDRRIGDHTSNQRQATNHSTRQQIGVCCVSLVCNVMNTVAL